MLSRVEHEKKFYKLVFSAEKEHLKLYYQFITAVTCSGCNSGYDYNILLCPSPLLYTL